MHINSYRISHFRWMRCVTIACRWLNVYILQMYTRAMFMFQTSSKTPTEISYAMSALTVHYQWRDQQVLRNSCGLDNEVPWLTFIWLYLGITRCDCLSPLPLWNALKHISWLCKRLKLQGVYDLTFRPELTPWTPLPLSHWQHFEAVVTAMF